MKVVAYKGVLFELSVTTAEAGLNRTYIQVQAQKIGEKDKVVFGGSVKNENQDS